MVKPKAKPKHGARSRLLRRLKSFAIIIGVFAAIVLIAGYSRKRERYTNEKLLHYPPPEFSAF